MVKIEIKYFAYSLLNCLFCLFLLSLVGPMMLLWLPLALLLVGGVTKVMWPRPLENSCAKISGLISKRRRISLGFVQVAPLSVVTTKTLVRTKRLRLLPRNHPAIIFYWKVEREDRAIL